MVEDAGDLAPIQAHAEPGLSGRLENKAETATPLLRIEQFEFRARDRQLIKSKFRRLVAGDLDLGVGHRSQTRHLLRLITVLTGRIGTPDASQHISLG